MNPTEPHTYPRRILLMVTGRSPQVVTETLYALCREQDPPFVPTEVRIVTTSEGAQDARLSLLSEDPGWFGRLRRDWDLPEIRFGPEQIQMLTDGEGRPLADIRTRADNDQAADVIVDTVRRITDDDQCALHVSLAGGRKTMGYFLGYALSLYGRPQDRLSHVLVSPPFESNRDFFYPTPSPRVIYTVHAVPAQQRPLDARDGRVTLADIPFVRLRDHLPGHLKVLESGLMSFSEVVATTQQALEPSSVTLDYPQGLLRIDDGSTVHMPPAALAFYGWIARRMRQGLGPVAIPTDGVVEESYLAGYLDEYRLAGSRPLSIKNLDNEQGLSKVFFEQRKHRIKKALEQQLGPRAYRYDLQPIEPGPPIRWGLTMAPEAIAFIEE